MTHFSGFGIFCKAFSIVLLTEVLSHAKAVFGSVSLSLLVGWPADPAFSSGKITYPFPLSSEVQAAKPNPCFCQVLVPVIQQICTKALEVMEPKVFASVQRI